MGTISGTRLSYFWAHCVYMSKIRGAMRKVAGTMPKFWGTVSVPFFSACKWGFSAFTHTQTMMKISNQFYQGELTIIYVFLKTVFVIFNKAAGFQARRI